MSYNAYEWKSDWSNKTTKLSSESVDRGNRYGGHPQKARREKVRSSRRNEMAAKSPASLQELQRYQWQMMMKHHQMLLHKKQNRKLWIAIAFVALLSPFFLHFVNSHSNSIKNNLKSRVELVQSKLKGLSF